MHKISAIIILIICNITIGFAQKSEALSKSEVVDLYKGLYKGSEIEPILWEGNIKRCNPGVLDEAIYINAEKRVNFFRLVNQLPQIKLDPSLNEDAQNAALLIKSNNKLTHTPSKSMNCYSQSAYDGCNKSNLTFIDWEHFPEMGFLTSFIRDYGAANAAVGHRRWILYSKLTSIGYGATNSSEALLVADGVDWKATSDLEFITYPWHGYVPVDLIFPKWSFSIPENFKVDFSKVKITMKDGKGNIIKSKKLKERKNFLDHTIVWTAEGLFTIDDINQGLNTLEEKGFVDEKISVEIKNVIVDGEKRSFEYFVEPIVID